MRIRDTIFCAFLLVITFVYRADAQMPYIQWQKCLGGSDADFGSKMIQCDDSGYVVVGHTRSNDGQITGYHGGEDVWVAKLSKTGTLIWQKCYGGSASDWGIDIQKADTGFIVVGYSLSMDGDVTTHFGSPPYSDTWLLKLNDTGRIMWQRSLGGPGGEIGYRVKQTTDGGYIIASVATASGGEVTGFHSGVSGSYDFWIAKTDDTGALVWQNCYGGSDFDQPYAIQQTADGGYLVLGFTMSVDGDISSNHGGKDVWLIKISATGVLLWQKTYGGSGNDIGYGLTPTSDGNYVIVGYTGSSDGDVSGAIGGLDVWTIKIDGLGAILWAKNYGGTQDDAAISVVETPDHGFALGCTISSHDHDITSYYDHGDGWVVKIDSAGNLEGQNNFGGDSIEKMDCIISTTDGDLAFLCSTNSINHDITFNHGSFDYWVVKIGIAPTTYKATVAPQPTFSAYPNPAKSTLFITLPNTYERSELRLIDVFGRRIILPNFSGTTRTLDLVGIAAGTYLLEAINEKGTIRLKVVVN